MSFKRPALSRHGCGPTAMATSAVPMGARQVQLLAACHWASDWFPQGAVLILKCFGVLSRPVMTLDTVALRAPFGSAQ